MNEKKKISLRVIRRISFYYEALLKLDLPEEEYISSRKLEEITGVSCNREAKKRVPGEKTLQRAETASFCG
jgi:NADH/NAD ratio-sensing transcriptional regulator Rex